MINRMRVAMPTPTDMSIKMQGIIMNLILYEQRVVMSVGLLDLDVR